MAGLELHGRVSLDGSGFEAGLRRMEAAGAHAFEHMKQMAVAAFGVAAIERAIHKTIEYGDHIVDMSRRVGVGIEALQELGYAAKQNGADLEELVGFMERLNSARIDPSKAGAFAKLGIDSSDLNSLKVEDLIMKLSANVQNRSSQEIIGPLREIGGKGAGAMIVMLKDNLAELRDEAERLALVMKTQDAVMFKAFKDQLMEFGQWMLVQLAPTITKAMVTMMYALNQFKAQFDFYKTFTSKGGASAFVEVLKALNGWTIGIFEKGTAGKIKEAFATMKKAFAESGGSNEGYLNELNEKTKKFIDELEARQKMIEYANSFPDFASVTDGDNGKLGKGAQLGQGDQWRQVGAFMTGSSDLIVDLSRQQVRKLHDIEKAIITQTRFMERNQSRGGTFGVPAT